MPLYHFVSALLATALEPVIDVHRHGTWPWTAEATYKAETLEEMDASGVRIAVLSVQDYDDIGPWLNGNEDRFILGVRIPCPRNLAEPRYHCFPSTDGWADVLWLEGEIRSRRVKALHELAPSYLGISPDNPRLAPYLALAHRTGVPVGIHTQRGPAPGGRNSTRSDPNCCPDYDPAMGNPTLLRPVLDRYPGLKVWIQHVGSGRGEYGSYWPETLALLADYPNVYVDLSITNGAMPAAQYEATLAKLINAGFGDRIMFGSDNLPVSPILERLRSFAWLSEEQRRAILYDNAARFFRLTDKQAREAGF